MKRFSTKTSPEKGKRMKYIPGNITLVKVIKANPGLLLAVSGKNGIITFLGLLDF